MKIPPLPKPLRRPHKAGIVDEHDNPICVPPSDLRPGDLLLSLGAANHSQWIHLLDGGSYSHVSYFDGSRLLELSANGVIHEDTAIRVQGQVYTDVYRFCRTKGRCLTARQAGAITQATRRYLGHPLAMHDLVLCALLVTTRKVNLPGHMEDLIRTILSAGVQRLRELIFNDQVEHMICSELVYRGFWEARNPGPIELLIFPQFPESLFRLPQVLPSAPNPGSPFSFRPTKGTEKLMEEFAELYVAHKAGRHHSLDHKHLRGFTEFSRKRLSAFLANDPIADYVTPRDIEESPSLVELGRACKADYPVS